VTGTNYRGLSAHCPRHKWALFTNREKFDLIAMYNSLSESFGFGHSPLSALVRTIYETEFWKILKRMPVCSFGGLDVWRKEFGDEETVSKGEAVR